MEQIFFPTTLWSQIRQGAGHSNGREHALSELAQRYQKPAEAYLRAALHLKQDQAQDLFQSFFAWMLSSEFLSKAEPQRGRFRTFLKVALRRFASDDRRKQTAERRGGHVPSAESLDQESEPPDPSAKSPDQILDEAWRAAIVTQAYERLRQDLQTRGRAAQFAVFRDYYFSAGAPLDYRALAERHGLTTTDVSNYLQRAKKSFREHLRTLVLDTVSDAEELGSELSWLVTEAES